MSLLVERNSFIIDKETRELISYRYKRITKAINIEFWGSLSDTDNSRYVGSYGRGTAINTSDIDILHVLPDIYYEHFTSMRNNGQSRLLQTVKNAVEQTYSQTDIKGDGQVVVVKFSDGMKFEILPAFKNSVLGYWDGVYKYPDTHMGGNWLSTNPLAEQEAMKKKNANSNGLLFDTCKHIRYIRDEYFSTTSDTLSGIIIDSFVYSAIGGWHWLSSGEEGSGKPRGTYEQMLSDYYNDNFPFPDICTPRLYAPGSNLQLDTGRGWKTLGKVLDKMI